MAVMPKLSKFTEPSATAMQWLVLAVAYFTLLLFLIGVVDLLIGLVELVFSGAFTDPAAVVNLLNTLLLLLIIVEVHRTLIAYARQEPVIRIVIGAALIAVSREIIGFRVGQFNNASDALTVAGGYGLLLVGLVVAYFIVRRTERDVAASETH